MNETAPSATTVQSNARGAASADEHGADRPRLIREAFQLEYVTIAWMIVEGAVAIWSGVVAHSLTLTAFGVDSVIELVSAAVLVWRLRVELKRDATFARAAERRASRIGGILLFALAAYVVGSAAWSLWSRSGEQFSGPGLIVALIAIPTMYVLAKRKLVVAKALNSRALRSDAMESITCGWLSFVVVLGLLADLALKAWWVDAVTSLPIVYLLVKEAREAWVGDDGCMHERR